MTHTIYECIYFYAININLRLSTICKAVNSFDNKPWVILTVRYFCITKRLKLDFKMFNSWDEKLNELVFVIRLQQKKCFNISNNCFWQWLQINRVFTSLILDGFKLQQKNISDWKLSNVVILQALNVKLAATFLVQSVQLDLCKLSFY